MSKPNGTILTIEDSEVVRYQIKTFLESHGYEVLEAENGDVGLELARTAKPSLILLDIVMPGRNGYQTIRALRDDLELMVIPVIFISSKDQPFDKDYGERQGATAYLAKPVDNELLLHYVRMLA